MSTFSNQYLAEAAMMPLITGGELRMWNFTMPGLDTDAVADDQWVVMDWKAAYLRAVEFLRDMGASEEDVSAILTVTSGLREIEHCKSLSAEVRRRLFDIHRIRLAILLLYPSQKENQRVVFSGKNEYFGGRSMCEVMTLSGTAEVRRWLEGRLQG